MAVVIKTNVDAIKVRHNLNAATNTLSQKMERLSSGLKVLSAKDDAAGNVIAARMQVQLDGNLICQQNVQNGNAMLETTEGHLNVILDNLTRIRDLTLQAKNGTYSDEEVQAMQDEVAERIEEIDRISVSSKFSSLHLFEVIGEDGQATKPSEKDGSIQTNGATLQVGANSPDDNTIMVDKSLFASVKFTALTGVDKNDTFNLSEIKKGTDDNLDFKQALDDLDKAIDNVTARQSIIGSAQNRLESALDTLTTQYENLSSARSLITDADIAKEATDFTQNSILQQVSTSLLTQANQAPAIALSLI